MSVKYNNNGDWIIKITQRQDDILKIMARIRLWNAIVKQIPRGCVWNLRKRDDKAAKLSEFLALGEEHGFGSFRAGLLKRFEDNEYLNGFLSALGTPPGLLKKISVEDKGLLCMRWLANTGRND